ncbi:MAG: DUF1553 domain-containing protein, partial [Phycisphaerales bacterium]|nr:DUF1553 domain-containing protein [Phycisphaerales bacterium]
FARDWDVRAMLRLMVTSHTYRQASHADAASLAIDPQNRFLWRASRLRLPAESIRDQALASSGLLVPEIGGPSVMPYQPEGLWKDVAYDPSGREFTGQVYKQGTGPDLYRRSMYTYWKRSSPPPELATFDAPNREICTVQRARTNTPLQALVLLNSPTFVEASRMLAQRVLLEIEGDDARLDRMYEYVLSRSPSARERRVLREILRDETFTPEDAASLLAVGEAPVAASLDPVELARWASIASIILNLDEAITRG